jgi:DNA-binding HxlR family transcriptional regulator
MKQDKAAAKETTTINVRYCPYCGSSSISSIKDKIVCLSCGGSFVAAGSPELGMANRQRGLFMGEVPERRRPSLMPAFRVRTPLGVRELDKPLSTLDVPQGVHEAARAIYVKAHATEMGDHRVSDKALAAAASYAACRQEGLSKSLDEIAAAFGVDRTEVENSYTFLLNEMGYLSPLLSNSRVHVACKPPLPSESMPTVGGREAANVFDVEKFLEKKGTYEFLRLLKERPRRWKTLETELALSPRTLSERIAQALEMGYIEKVRRLKIGATYYRLTRRGNEMFEAMTGNTSIY